MTDHVAAAMCVPCSAVGRVRIGSWVLDGIAYCDDHAPFRHYHEEDSVYKGESTWPPVKAPAQVPEWQKDCPEDVDLVNEDGSEYTG